MDVLTIVGARPQFVKAAVLSRAFQKLGVQEKILHTGQHYDAAMSDVFFEEMEIPKPSFNLDVHGVGHGAMTGRMLEGIEQILLDEQPKVVLVYGDTNSTLAGALAASKLHVPVAHVEAGLRSFNMNMPEEVNRILTDRISTLLFTPTQTATNNLHQEGYRNLDISIHQSGDVMEDAAKFYAAKLDDKPSKLEQLPEEFALVTCHRAENTDAEDNLKAIVAALNEIHTTLPIVLPLHPRTKAKLAAFGLNLNVHLIEPVGYFDMIRLLKGAKCILTDSGGLQKEAYFFKKPCVTMRDETEWVELVQAGVNRIVGANKEAICTAVRDFLSMDMDFSKDLYGGGNAGDKMAKIIQEKLL